MRFNDIIMEANHWRSLHWFWFHPGNNLLVEVDGTHSLTAFYDLGYGDGEERDEEELMNDPEVISMAIADGWVRGRYGEATHENGSTAWRAPSGKGRDAFTLALQGRPHDVLVTAREISRRRRVSDLFIDADARSVHLSGASKEHYLETGQMEQEAALAEALSPRINWGADLPSWNPTNIDFALMTFREFMDVTDKDRKSHPSSAYQTTVASLSEYRKATDYPRIIRQTTIRGLKFTFRMNEEKLRYAKRSNDDFNPWERDADGKIIYHSDEEIAAMNVPTHDQSVAVFDEDGHAVASIQDEWGCVLVMVAQPYKGFGFGAALFRLWASLFPGKPSGGYTPEGFNSARKMHREIVRDALASGRYSKMVRAGEITMERVQEILASVDLSKKASKPSATSLSNTNPKDWLFYSAGHGDFIIYDRKLKDLWDEEGDATIWADRMLLAMVYVAIDGNDYGRIKVFGGESEKLKALVMSFAVHYALENSAKLVVEPEDIRYLPKGTSYDEVSKARGYDSVTVTGTTHRSLDLRPFLALEQQFRKSFDRHDEFLHRMTETAYAKF